MTFTEICNAVLDHPKVQEGFIQQQFSLDRVRVVPVAGAPGVWNWDTAKVVTFRIVLYTDSKEKMIETNSRDLLCAIRGAFEGLGIPRPDWLPEKK